jgi:hypothetical protein
MPDAKADHLTKAEACRRLADIAGDAARRAMWDERAEYWERLAAKPPKQKNHRKPR